MRTPADETAAMVSTRRTLHRVAAHVLGRRRFAVTGRFGLRASPDGIATPAFGDGPEVLRVAGATLVREQGGEVTQMALEGANLAVLAAFAGTDLDPSFSVGDSTPPLGDPDAPLTADRHQLRLLADWFWLGWRVLDTVVSELPGAADPATVQLWPEHFDASTNVASASGNRVNLGFSAGDDTSPEPYCYVGPWGPERGGDPEYWNVSFGAVLRSSELSDADAEARCLEFLRCGLEQAARP